jgi:hypothetical protein
MQDFGWGEPAPTRRSSRVFGRSAKNGVDGVGRSQCLLAQDLGQAEQMVLGLLRHFLMHEPQAEHRAGEDRHYRQGAQAKYEKAQAPREFRPRRRRA